MVSIFLTSTHLFSSTKTFGDNFNSVDYGNNDGTDDFTANWDEIEPWDVDNDPASGYIKIDNNELFFDCIWNETISRSLDLSGSNSVILTFDLVTNDLAGDIQDVQMLNDSNNWVTVLSINETTSTGPLTYTLDPQFIHASSAIRFIARANWDTTDNLRLDNLLFSIDRDTDGDSVLDENDIDDDNDGILDIVEDTPIIFNATDSSSTGNTRNRTNAEGPIETEGSTADNSNSAELRNNGDTLTLDLGRILPAGTVITLSMARDQLNTANSVTISGGGTSLTLTNSDWSSNDTLKYFYFTLSSADDSLLFTLNSDRDIWVDGLQVIYGNPNYFDMDQDASSTP